MRTDSEGWTVFLARRIVLPFLGVSSPDYNQNRTDLVTVDRQRMRVVAGSEGATDKSTPDCPHCTLLYYIDSVLSCTYNQPVMPEDALLYSTAPEQTAKNEYASYKNPGNRG